jgi:predicted RNase H-like nuclease
MRSRKKSREGAQERIEVLSRAFEDDLSALAAPAGAARDDLLDACAVAWTAWRLAQDRAVRLAAEPEVDMRGLRMEIVY